MNSKEKNIKKILFFMAIATMGATFDQVRGKIGRIVGTVGHGPAPVIRIRRKGINPRSGSQQDIRSLMTTYSKAWGVLTQSQQEEWNATANQTSKTNRLGTKYTTTGSKLYVAYNIENALNGGVTPIVDPIFPTAPATVQASALTAVASTTPQTMTITTVGAVPANSVLVVEATPCLSPGKWNVKGRYRRIKVIAGGTTAGSQDIYAAYEAEFGGLITGRKVWVKILTSNNDAAANVTLFPAQAPQSVIVG